MKVSNINTNGFTLFELLIALSIVAILAGIGTPMLVSYLNRAAYSEIVQAADSYKSAVTLCLEINSADTSVCDAGSHGIPPAITTAVGKVASASVEGGVITITPVAGNGILSSDTYILTPTLNTGSNVTWQVSGGACSKYVTNCTGG